MDHGSLKRDFSWNNMAVNLTSLDCLSQTEQDIWRLFFSVSEWFIKDQWKKQIHQFIKENIRQILVKIVVYVAIQQTQNNILCLSYQLPPSSSC